MIRHSFCFYLFFFNFRMFLNASELIAQQHLSVSLKDMQHSRTVEVQSSFVITIAHAIIVSWSIAGRILVNSVKIFMILRLTTTILQNVKEFINIWIKRRGETSSILTLLASCSSWNLHIFLWWTMCPATPPLMSSKMLFVLRTTAIVLLQLIQRGLLRKILQAVVKKTFKPSLENDMPSRALYHPVDYSTMQ
jgi:hypothetical protein